MAEKKSFLLRVDPQLLDDVKRWADDELRSLNGQIEYLLRRALADSGRRRQSPHGGESERSESTSTDQP
jgi:hypothetical protein